VSTQIGPISIAAGADDGEFYQYGGWNWVNDSTTPYMGDSDDVNYWGYFTFTLPSAIPSGATIDAGTKIEIYGLDIYNWTTGDALQIYVEQSSNAPAIDGVEDRPTGDGGGTTLGASSVRWPVSGDLTWTYPGWNEREIISLIQELVDDYGGLASGAKIRIWVTKASGTDTDDQVGWESLENAGSNPAKLTIVYTAGGNTYNESLTFSAVVAQLFEETLLSPTRIYLPSSGSPAVTPSDWEFANQDANANTFAGVRTKINSAFANQVGSTGTTRPILKAMLRYVAGPLTAQEISGNINAVIRAMEDNTGANATLGIAVKIIAANGVDRAILLAAAASDSNASPQEFATSLNSRRAWTAAEARPIPLTPGNATAGDYLVIELGFRSYTTTARTITLRCGDNNANNLPDADADANEFCPWVQFSGNIGFQGGNSFNANLTLSAVANMGPIRSMTLNPSLSLLANAGVAEGSQGIFGKAISLPVLAEVNYTKNIIFGKTLSLDAAATQAQIGGLAFAVSLTLTAAAGQTQIRTLSLNRALSLLAQAGVSEASQGIFGKAITLEGIAEIGIEKVLTILKSLSLDATAAQSQTGGMKIDESITLQANATLSGTRNVDLWMVLSLNSAASLTPQAAGILVGSVILAAVAGVDPGAVLNIPAALSLAVAAGQVQSCALILDKSLNLEVLAAMARTYGLEISKVLTLDAQAGISGAIPAIIFNPTLDLNAVAGFLAEGAGGEAPVSLFAFIPVKRPRRR
jgi:hypothetical protein